MAKNRAVKTRKIGILGLKYFNKKYYVKMPITLKKEGITILPATSSATSASTSSATSASVSLVPPSLASPLRQRLKQRIEENAIEVKEETKNQKAKKKSPAKSKKDKPEKTEAKKVPKVYASPTWFKSPTQRKIQAKNKQFDELRELFRKDGNNTEEGINKIINDLKF